MLTTCITNSMQYIHSMYLYKKNYIYLSYLFFNYIFFSFEVCKCNFDTVKNCLVFFRKKKHQERGRVQPNSDMYIQCPVFIPCTHPDNSSIDI